MTWYWRYLDRKTLAQAVNEVEHDSLQDDWESRVLKDMLSIDMVDNLCKRCWHALCNRRRITEHGIFQQCSAVQLESGSRMGCSFCRLWSSTLRSARLLKTYRKLEQRLHSLGSSATLLLLQRHPTTDHSISSLQPTYPGHICGPDNCQVDISTIDEDVLPADPFRLANSWLQRCIDEHSCSIAVSRRPSRLVSIAAEPKLTHTAGLIAMPRYATLSYCWGTEDFLKLTNDNYVQFMQGIPYESLPLTFRDAIDVARALGLEWIWIDALCIVQGDAPAWHEESALMADIYGGSHLNIAVTTSPTVHDGALTKPDNHISSFTARLAEGVVLIHDIDSWAQAVSESALTKRAWAFQERLLSPRTLYLSNKGFYWECPESQDCEVWSPDVSPIGIDGFCLGRRSAWNWPDLITRYSQANLTYASDRLTAISGLAKCQHNITNDTYFAGMWRDSLETHLLWKCQQRTPRTQRWAPTWSWASVDRGVSWPGRLLRMPTLIRIVSVQTILASTDPFGAVDGGSLTIECRKLLRGRLLDWQTVGLDSSDNRLHFTADCTEDTLVQLYDPVYMLPVTTETHNEVHGLVIQSNQKGQFRRLGIFSYFSSTDLDVFTLLLQLPQDDGILKASLDCNEASEEERGQQHCVITII